MTARTVRIVRGAIAAPAPALYFSPNKLGHVVVDEEGCEIWKSSEIFDGASVFYVRKRLECPLPLATLDHLSASYLCVPFQGWEDGRWFDGPIISKDNQHFLAFVPEGFPAVLELQSLQRGVQASQVGCAPPPSYLGSLMTAMRHWASPEGRMKFAVQHFQLDEYVTWVLLRKAFPAVEWVPVAHAPYKLWPPAAKRVCQHLGWSLYERGTEDEDLPEIILAPFRAAIEKLAPTLAAECNRVSRVIPPSLLPL